MNKKTFSFFSLLFTAFVLIISLNINTFGQSAQTDLVKWPELMTFTDKWLTDRQPEDGDSLSSSLNQGSNINFTDFALWAQNWRKEKVKSYVIAYNPYQGVDWYHWHRELAQHHDHIGRLSLDRIKAYDRAGYNVIAALDYAGKRSAGTTYCTYRLWPVYKYLSGFNSDQEVLATLSNIRLFLPDMEEIGSDHITSPFMTTYIELWEPAYCGTRQSWHYETSQQCIDLINQYGGLPIIAHPMENSNYYLNLQNYKCIEIFNAHYYRLWILGQSSIDYNEHFQDVWDQLLINKDTKIWGFAVNDWWGPWNNSEDAFIDSGKILVMAPSYDMADYRRSLEKGCFFAIQDCGVGRQNKGHYPVIAEITASSRSITINTDGQVSWIANGQRIAQGSSINITNYPLQMNYKYVRAEISNAYGTVFTQPWTLSSSQ